MIRVRNLRPNLRNQSGEHRSAVFPVIVPERVEVRSLLGLLAFGLAVTHARKAGLLMPVSFDSRAAILENGVS